MFMGFVEQEGTLVLRFQARDASLSPTNLDALPTYRVYGPQGLMSSGTGTCSQVDSGNVNGLYAASIAALGANGYAAGTTYAVYVEGAISSVAWADLHTFCVG